MLTVNLIEQYASDFSAGDVSSGLDYTKCYQKSSDNEPAEAPCIQYPEYLSYVHKKGKGRKKYGVLFGFRYDDVEPKIKSMRLKRPIGTLAGVLRSKLKYPQISVISQDSINPDPTMVMRTILKNRIKS